MSSYTERLNRRDRMNRNASRQARRCFRDEEGRKEKERKLERGIFSEAELAELISWWKKIQLQRIIDKPESERTYQDTRYLHRVNDGLVKI